MNSVFEWDTSDFQVVGTSRDDRDQDPVEASIREIGELPEGWEFGRGRGATAETVGRALNLYRIMSALYPSTVEAAPGGVGGIKLTFVCDGDTFLDVSVRPDGLYDWTVERGLGMDYEVLEEETGLDLARITQRIHSRFRQARPLSRWHSCGLFTPDVILGASEDSIPRLFRTTEMAFR